MTTSEDSSSIELSSPPSSTTFHSIAEDDDVVEDGASSQATPAYKPQFSTSSSWILERLGKREHAAGADSSNGIPLSSYSVKRDCSSSEMPSTQPVASTLVMPSPRSGAPLAAISDIAKQLAHFHSPSLKRKRSPVYAEADFTQNTIPFPAAAEPPQMATSSPYEGASESGSARQCSKCGQGSLPSADEYLVTCIGCQGSWHLQCVSTTADVTDSANHLCLDCKMESGGEKQNGSDNTEAHERRQMVDRIRSKRLSQLPVGVFPAKPELLGFYARQASDAERTDYFYRKKRTDLLNILSFCDQVKPQLLVDMLVSVSRKHPDLPIFDDPDWKANLPGRAAHPTSSQTSQSAGMSSQPRHGLALLHAKDSRKPRVRLRLTKQTAVAEADMTHAEIAVVHGADVVEHSLPPTWPKAGQGLYAKLPPEDEDREYLVDDNDEEAFSHFKVDKTGRQMMVSACA